MVDDVVSLVKFASRKRHFHGWVDDLPDKIFNQVWDAVNAEVGIGTLTISHWLRSLGYEDATASRINTVTRRERRP